MSQSYDHHAEDYEDYEGYPDGRDLYDAYMEMTMQPSFDEQMDAIEKPFIDKDTLVIE